MTESAHTFGSGARLFGILSEPDDRARADERPCVLIVNSGLLPRVGPFRLHTLLARRLTQRGLRSFRIDLSGIGDSGRHTDNRRRDEQHIGDIGDAIQYLHDARGVERCVVLGICTGADLAHKAILRDPRIVGAVCIDGYAYPTLRYRLNVLLGKLRSAKSWRALARRLTGQRGNGDRLPAAEDQLAYRWELPPIDRTREEYRTLMDSNRHMLCVFTSSWPYNYARQLQDAFPDLDFDERLRAVFLQDTTHTFKLAEDRARLFDAVDDWLDENADFAAATSEAR